MVSALPHAQINNCTKTGESPASKFAKTFEELRLRANEYDKRLCALIGKRDRMLPDIQIREGMSETLESNRQKIKDLQKQIQQLEHENQYIQGRIYELKVCESNFTFNEESSEADKLEDEYSALKLIQNWLKSELPKVSSSLQLNDAARKIINTPPNKYLKANDIVSMRAIEWQPQIDKAALNISAVAESANITLVEVSSPPKIKESETTVNEIWPALPSITSDVEMTSVE